MKYLYISDFCKMVGMSPGKTEETSARLSKMGVEPMGYIIGERDGAPFDRPIYVQGQSKIIDAYRATKKPPSHHESDDRLDHIERQLSRLMTELGSGGEE
tara:strand:+ start:11109 stop:11408 length:300 start_codon:yes stop_codon:yes gene_type:complete